MMQDPIENKQFENLLSDYAAPIDDDGFSAHLMAQLPKSSVNTQDTENLRRRFIGGGAIIGAAIAATQLPALVKLIGKFNMPYFNMPNINVPTLTPVDTSLFMTASGMAVAALVLMSAIWLSSTFIFGDQM